MDPSGAEIVRSSPSFAVAQTEFSGAGGGGGRVVVVVVVVVGVDGAEEPLNAVEKKMSY